MRKLLGPTRRRGFPGGLDLYQVAGPRQPYIAPMEDPHVASEPDNVHAALASVSEELLVILSQLQAFSELPALQAAAAQARTIAANMLVLFRQEMFEHHADEERELFPAVLRNALPGHERQRAEAMVRHLTAEHRRMESLWSQLEPGVKAIAKGRAMDVALKDVEALVHAYRAHAGFEEQQFLPLAKTVLSRNNDDSAALALALHQRRGSR